MNQQPRKFIIVTNWANQLLLTLLGFFNGTIVIKLNLYKISLSKNADVCKIGVGGSKKVGPKADICRHGWGSQTLANFCLHYL